MELCERTLKVHTPPDAVELFRQVRSNTTLLIDGLSPEDTLIQSMEDASPSKWHLAHTTWFFEEMLLKAFASDYRPFSSTFAYLFNSYYEALGERHPRPKRGMLSRPSLQEVLDYRQHVDLAMEQLFETPALEHDEILKRLKLGCHHEMQHQELLITDQLHALSQHPFHPSWKQPRGPVEQRTAGEQQWLRVEGGLKPIGAEPSEFHYDCEAPRHQHYLEDCQMASRVIVNREWMEFMAEGGYSTPTLWLSDGWARCVAEGWQAPLYWHKKGDQWYRYTPYGLMMVNPEEPVCHISFFEADAFATWAGARLPSEQEWEVAAQSAPVEGRFMTEGDWLPRVPTAAGSATRETFQDLFGSVWEWTQSAYLAYPGFQPLSGALGEYNGKFMSGQFVLRGGGFSSPKALIRHSYRNFFYPHQRWQATGLRLAKND